MNMSSKMTAYALVCLLLAGSAFGATPEMLAMPEIKTAPAAGQAAAPAATAPAAAAQAAAPAAAAPAAPAAQATAPAAAPAAAAPTQTAAVPYEGHVQCSDGKCKIDSFLTKGFRTFGQCQVCHGMDGSGSTIAPSLMERLKVLDHATFIDRVTNGFKGQIGVMPTWKDNPNVMNNIENLYAYLKARSDGVIPAGNLERF